MDDNKIAKQYISAIIGEKIKTLQLVPTEMQTKVRNYDFTIYRLDFVAKIKTIKGYKTIIIEMQKAKLHTDIIRFRKYLGKQYSSDTHYETKTVTFLKNGITKEINTKKAHPIISIYFLGHKLDHIKIPFISVKRNYRNGITGEILTTKEDFIESLSHDSFVIQIPCLVKKRHTDIEYLLSIFDQENITSNHHILNINEEDFPEKYRPIIRRLQNAASSQDVSNAMEAEDEIIEELYNKEQEVEFHKEINVKLNVKLVEKDNKLAEKDNKLVEKDNMLVEKNNKLAKKDSIIAQKDAELNRLKKLLDKKQ
jgi:hypothetical protein